MNQLVKTLVQDNLRLIEIKRNTVMLLDRCRAEETAVDAMTQASDKQIAHSANCVLAREKLVKAMKSMGEAIPEMMEAIRMLKQGEEAGEVL